LKEPGFSRAASGYLYGIVIPRKREPRLRGERDARDLGFKKKNQDSSGLKPLGMTRISGLLRRG